MSGHIPRVMPIDAARRVIATMSPGDQVRLTAPDRNPEMVTVVLVETDSEGDPMLVLSDAGGARTVVDAPSLSRGSVGVSRTALAGSITGRGEQVRRGVGLEL